ncbi:MAG: hypothetical protein Q9186_006190 [Xanthomendoza sp. 1 TL-2023]
MPTDDARMVELIEAISNVSHESTSKDGQGLSLSNENRKKLIEYAEKLAIAAREPEENLYFQASQLAQNSTIRTAIDIGVFDRVPLPGNTSISRSELSTALKVDPDLLARIMRALTSSHLFTETFDLEPYYNHNAFSAMFLLPANRDMFKQLYDFVGQALYTMPRFLESTGYRNPSDYHHSPFQYGHNTSLGLWEFLNEKPERLRLFNSGMQSLTTIGGRSTSAGAYPFDQELSMENIDQEDVVIVDVGGGRGHTLEAIKARFPDLKGRMVLQDVREVIEDAEAGGLSQGIETMVASFFEPQPVSGALTYHFRRIFHDWSPNIGQQILGNTVQAMTHRSRVLIVDNVVPESGAPRSMSLQDIHMMSFGGMERTRRQWEDLLEGVGLRIQRIWEGEGNLQKVIEAVLVES